MRISGKRPGLKLSGGFEMNIENSERVDMIKCVDKFRMDHVRAIGDTNWGEVVDTANYIWAKRGHYLTSGEYSGVGSGLRYCTDLVNKVFGPKNDIDDRHPAVARLRNAILNEVYFLYLSEPGLRMNTGA